MNVLVCGGRHYSNYAKMKRTLKAYDIASLVHGGATGVDQLADRYARCNGIETHRYPAEWDFFGKRAGHLRNERMLLMHPEIDLVIAFAGGPGTADMIRTAQSRGVQVRKIR